MITPKKNSKSKSEKTVNNLQEKKTVRTKSLSEKDVNDKKEDEPKEIDIKCPYCGSKQVTVGKHTIDTGGGFDATGAFLTSYTNVNK